MAIIRPKDDGSLTCYRMFSSFPSSIEASFNASYILSVWAWKRTQTMIITTRQSILLLLHRTHGPPDLRLQTIPAAKQLSQTELLCKGLLISSEDLTLGSALIYSCILSIWEITNSVFRFNNAIRCSLVVAPFTRSYFKALAAHFSCAAPLTWRVDARFFGRFIVHFRMRYQDRFTKRTTNRITNEVFQFNELSACCCWGIFFSMWLIPRYYIKWITCLQPFHTHSF